MYNVILRYLIITMKFNNMHNIYMCTRGFLFTIAHSLIISDPSLILARSPLLIDSRSFSSFFVDSYRYFETISAFLSVHSWYKSKATAVNTILT